MICFGPYRLMTPTGPLLHGSDEVLLRPKSMEVLSYLAMHACEQVSKSEILSAIWPQVVVSDGVLAVCIREIRQALGDNRQTPHYIQTVHRRGYRFIASVTVPDPVASQTVAVANESTSVPATDWAMPVGREHELQQLQRCYVDARSGHCQLLFVSGEAGIGKTTLVEAWLRTLEQDGDVRVVRGECIEHYGASEAYLPLLGALNELCAGQEGDTVVAALRRTAPNWLLQLPALLDQPAQAALQEQVLGANAERMLREWIDLLAELSAERPLVLVLEDLHWSDPSTIEALALLAKRQKRARLLVVGTTRNVELIVQDHPLKTVKRELLLHEQCSELVLDYLTKTQIQSYLAQRFNKIASAALAGAIYRRTAGHPLYMVTLVGSLSRQEWFTAYLKSCVAEFPAVPLELLDAILPAGLQAAIEQQFERLSEHERQVLEVASVVGVEFELATVSAAAAVAEETVEYICETLSQQGQFITDTGLATWPDGTISGRYAFRHALYPEVVYRRIGSARRARLHQRIGECLEQSSSEQTGIVAADLARHFENSQDAIRAVRYLQQAADSAQRRYAREETGHYLRRALNMLERLPQTPQRDREELALLLRLGLVLVVIASRGYAAAEVEQVYARADILSAQVDDDRQVFLALRGLWVFYWLRGDYRRAQEAAERLLALAQHTQIVEDCLEAYRALGGVFLYRGQLSEARIRLEQGLALYQPQPQKIDTGHVINSPGLSCGFFHACVLWFIGYADQALVQADTMLNHARILEHPFTVACAMGYQTYLHQYRREPELTQACAESMLAYVHEQDFNYWSALGTALRGWARVVQGQYEAGLAELHRGVADYQSTGAFNAQAYFRGLLAEAQGLAGEFDTALATIAEALALTSRVQESNYEPELHRLNGELLLQQRGLASQKISEACFRRSLSMARYQQAKALELRTATSLAHLWYTQGKHQEAHDLLAPVYDWFTEGFDTADLKEAKVLLDEVS